MESKTQRVKVHGRASAAVRSADAKRRLGQWIRRGWKHRDGDRLRGSYMLYDKGEYTLILYTLGFALLGKEGSIQKGEQALDQVLLNNGSKPWQSSVGKVLGVSGTVIKKIERLEGPLGRKRPAEIANLLQSGAL
jgi:hypothetical protein